MKTLAALLGGIGLLATASGAGAMQYTWSTSGSATATAGTGCGSFSCQLVYGSDQNSAVTLTARAYAIDSTVSDALFGGATLTSYANGLGIQASGETSAGPNDNNPGYIDNSGLKEVLILEAPTDDFEWGSLSLALPTTGTRDTSPDLQIFVGSTVSGNNVADKDFSAMCFSGCAGSSTRILTDAGFTQLGPFNSLANLNIGDVGINAVGRYLVVSGALSDTGDFFRVAGVGGHTVPSPQTLPLLALGLVGMWAVMRRRVGT